MAVERDSKKSPIIDVKIISVMGKDSSGKEREKDKDGSSSAAAEKPAEETCPSDYTLVDKILTSHKGRDYYICYKVAVRRAVEYMAYEAFVLDRYPPTDHFDQPLEAQGVAMLSVDPLSTAVSACLSVNHRIADRCRCSVHVCAYVKVASRAV